MEALELYKFIEDNDVEWHYYEDELGNDDVIIFPYYFHIDRFRKILSPTDFDEEGISCVMKDGYFAFCMRDLCDRHGIELNEVFPKEEEQ